MYSEQTERGVSIPRSGFCGVGRRVPTQGRPRSPVSIPRSGFCGVGPPGGMFVRLRIYKFQSLGRDSVGWDRRSLTNSVALCRVSIPRSGFCGVGLHIDELVYYRDKKVSIPRSGFCGVGPSINPSIRYLSLEFQSLGRDSVGWDPRPSTLSIISIVGFNPSVGILWGGTSKEREGK